MDTTGDDVFGALKLSDTDADPLTDILREESSRFM
jgi:hypothetical protein